jgi:hypothetical protein
MVDTEAGGSCRRHFSTKVKTLWGEERAVRPKNSGCAAHGHRLKRPQQDPHEDRFIAFT